MDIGGLFWRTRTGSVIVVAAGGAEHCLHAILRYISQPLSKASGFGEMWSTAWSYADYLDFFKKEKEKELPSRLLFERLIHLI